MAIPNPKGTPSNLSPHPRPNINKEIENNPVAKFKRDLHKFSRNKVPRRLLDLYDWCKKNVPEGDFNQIIELKNMYKVLQSRILPQQIDKAIHGEPLTKREQDSFRLLKDFMVESYRLEYGDKKTVTHEVTYKDVRKQIFSDKKIISAKVVENDDVSQDLDRSGCSEEYGKENRENDGDSREPSESGLRSEHNQDTVSDSEQ